MEAGFQLKTLLQLQLASDASAVAHLPYVLSSLNEQSFASNSHLTKWTARITSLMHSKDPGARWAGLCIAHKSSIISKSFMVDSAAAWLPIAIPLLTRPEPTPVLKASIRLLTTVFTAAIEMSEFQRQISLPHVPKFTAALANVAGSHEDPQLKALCLDTLARLMPVYPNAHRATFGNLSALALSFLNGSFPTQVPTPVMEAAARLYSILHLTGGKVGAANLWRKALDDTLAFGWDAFAALRTTFPVETTRSTPSHPEGVDPSINIPLNVDKLRCCSVIIRDLLSTMTTRPVQMPTGQLIRFAVALVGASTEGQVDGFVDPTTRAMEISVVPALWKFGCEIISTLAESIPQYLEPSVSKLYAVLAYRLEQHQSPQQRLLALSSLQKLLQASRFVDAPILPNRITRAVLPSLVVVLSSSSTAIEANPDADASNKKGKKKAKNYAGDEVFKVSRDVICPTDADADVLLSALEVIRSCIQNPNLSNSQLSLSTRILLSIQLSLSQLSPSILSPNPQVFQKVQKKVNSICTEIASSSSVSLQKTLPLIAKECAKIGDTELHASLDLLLHPRLPPIVRPIPATQSLTLFRVEESEEEALARSQLGLEFQDGLKPASIPSNTDQDAVMNDSFAPTTAPAQPPREPPKPASEPVVAKPFFTAPAAPAPVVPPVVAPPAPAPWAGPSTAESQAPVKVIHTTPMTTASTSLLPPADEDEDDDEEMPTIDMASDSEEDED